MQNLLENQDYCKGTLSARNEDCNSHLLVMQQKNLNSLKHGKLAAFWIWWKKEFMQLFLFI